MCPMSLGLCNRWGWRGLGPLSFGGGGTVFLQVLWKEHSGG